MKLTHVGIGNFRSIGEDFVTIGLTKKINFLVGANNCGKLKITPSAAPPAPRHECTSSCKRNPS